MTVPTGATPLPAAAPPPALVPAGRHDAKPPFHLDRAVMLIGARHRADIRLESAEVSRSHAVVVNAGGRVTVRDLASRTHVYVNGRQVREVVLEDGDHVNIGRFALRFLAGGAAASAPSGGGAARAAVLTGDKLAPGGVSIAGALCVVGSRPGVDVLLKGSDVSFAHAVIYAADGRHLVRDLGSRTGTFVDGAAVKGDAALSVGSVIRIGSCDLRYEPLPPPAEEVADVAPPAASPTNRSAITTTARLEPGRTTDAGVAPIKRAGEAPPGVPWVSDSKAPHAGAPRPERAPAPAASPIAVKVAAAPAGSDQLGFPAGAGEETRTRVGPDDAHASGIGAVLDAYEHAHGANPGKSTPPRDNEGPTPAVDATLASMVPSPNSPVRISAAAVAAAPATGAGLAQSVAAQGAPPGSAAHTDDRKVRPPRPPPGRPPGQARPWDADLDLELPALEEPTALALGEPTAQTAVGAAAAPPGAPAGRKRGWSSGRSEPMPVPETWGVLATAVAMAEQPQPSEPTPWSEKREPPRARRSWLKYAAALVAVAAIVVAVILFLKTGVITGLRRGL